MKKFPERNICSGRKLIKESALLCDSRHRQMFPQETACLLQLLLGSYQATSPSSYPVLLWPFPSGTTLTPNLPADAPGRAPPHPHGNKEKTLSVSFSKECLAPLGQSLAYHTLHEYSIGFERATPFKPSSLQSSPLSTELSGLKLLNMIGTRRKN